MLHLDSSAGAHNAIVCDHVCALASAHYACLHEAFVRKYLTKMFLQTGTWIRMRVYECPRIMRVYTHVRERTRAFCQKKSDKNVFAKWELDSCARIHTYAHYAPTHPCKALVRASVSKNLTKNVDSAAPCVCTSGTYTCVRVRLQARMRLRV